MRFKKILFIVLMMFICYGTVDIKVSAESTSKVNVTDELTTKAVARTTSLKTTQTYSRADLRLMSAIIFCEAGGESYAGKVAVGIVVANRKTSAKFPNTIKGVVYQKSQFQPARNGSLAKALKRYDSGKFTTAAEKACVKAAKAALTNTKSVTYKNKTIKLNGFYFFSRQLSGARVKIGNHRFK